MRVKPNKIQYLGAIPFLMTLAVSANAESIDVDYLKEHHPELYQQVMKVEACRTSGKADCSTQDATEKKTAKASSKAPTTAQGGSPWWLSSSYDQDGPNKQVQQRISGQFTAKLEDGNDKGHRYLLMTDYNLRYDRWTNYLTLAYFRDKLEESGEDTTDKKYSMIRDAVRYDLNETWYGEAGFIFEEDSSEAIDLREIFFAGFGAYLLNTSTKQLNITAAFGHEEETFEGDVVSLLGLDSWDYEMLYLYESFNWQISPKLAFKQGFRSLSSLKKLPRYDEIYVPLGDEFGDTPIPEREGFGRNCESFVDGAQGYCVEDERLKHQIKLMFGLEYMLSQNFSLMYSIDFSYDSVPWPGVEETQTTNNLAVKFQYQ